MPPTLGQRLKHAREKRGLSLRDVEHDTRIPVARLQDLEEDKLNTFGGMAYAKSFLRAYSNLLDVNAEEILGQMKPPPLGGARDYRYLVETQGLWINRRDDRYAPALVAPSLNGGRPLMFAALICLALGVLIGGGVLASVYFNSKPAAEAAAQERLTAASPPSSTPEPTSNGLPGGAYVFADELATEREFNVLDVRVAIVEKKPGTPTTPPVPPKAVPVIESATSKLPPPPKAEAVR